MNNSYAVTVSCPKSTSNMAWVDGNSVGLGCLGFSRKSGYRSLHPLAIDVCKKANSKAHLVEIYNEKQVRFMMTAKIQKYVGHSGWWWIGGELKHGKWYWTHSNKPIKYVPKIGGDQFTKGYPYLRLYLSKTQAYFDDEHENSVRVICQISK